MATITSSSTQADIVEAYLDGVSYDTEGSVSKAKTFIEACRALLVMHPADWQKGAHRIMYRPELWQTQLERALKWLDANEDLGTSGGPGRAGVKHLDFRGFRD